MERGLDCMRACVIYHSLSLYSNSNSIQSIHTIICVQIDCIQLEFEDKLTVIYHTRKSNHFSMTMTLAFLVLDLDSKKALWS